jgi:hypothetical protein
MHYSYDARIYYLTDIKWHPATRQLKKLIPPWQIVHRSRDVVLSGAALRIPELRKNKAKYEQFVPKLPDESKLSEEESHAIFDIVMEHTLKYLAFDYEHILHYAREHKESSIGHGHRWNEAELVTEDEWRSIFNETVRVAEMIAAHPGLYNQIVFSTGLRGRPNRLEGPGSRTEGEVDRSRIVLFSPSLNIWNAFIIDKAGWYEAIMNDVVAYLSPDPVFIMPQISGGQLYIDAAEFFKDDIPFEAWDGKAWESNTAAILGVAFNPFMINLLGCMMLPSGIALTSLLNTIANIVYNRRGSGTHIISGDDDNVFGGKPGKGISMEYQPDDTLNKYILGITYRADPMLPRICGWKVTTDRSTKSLPLRSTPGEHDIVVGSKHTPEARSAGFGMFLGHYGEGSLLQALSEVSAADFKSPGMKISELITAAKPTDAFAWAEALGIADVFV